MPRGSGPRRHTSLVRCIGAILAGGRATRFGGAPKGLERVGGRPIVERVAASLRAASDELMVVANDRAAAEWVPGARVVSDLIAGAGSLGGLHAALAQAGAPVLVVAWDMPFVPASLLRELRATGEAMDVDAVVPESGSRHGLEPLCAWYAPTCLDAIARRLDAGDRRAVSFLADVRVQRLPLERVRAHGDPETLFLNVNTPAELGVAEAHGRERAHPADAGGGRTKA